MEDSKPPLVPKLRFSEFQDATGWTEMPLKAAAHINPPNGGLPESFVYIDLESVDAGELKAKERISRIGAPSRAQRFVERGDIIYQVVRPYQRNNLLCEFDDDEDYVASTGYAQLRAKESNRFLYQSIHTDSFVGRVIAKCTGSNYPAINSSDLAEITLPLPPTIAEQQKIAECLSSVDELMAAQARKLDALKTHKKGLMQQLFPSEGETQPRLRFPEFQNAGEWEDKSLGQLIEIASGQVDPKQPPYCDSPQIGSENIESHSGKLVNVRSAGEKGVISGNYAFDENDILYSKIRPALNKVASPVFKGICSADIYPIRPADVSLLRGYLFYLLLSQEFLDYAIRNSERGKIPKINRDALVAYKALIPSAAEQQRIADCLTSLDDLIVAEAQKLDALKSHKKGLMQQLFPSPGEVEV
jgi:type I restriction enzyme S subunit